jgi:hypothetical protein
LNHCSPPMHYSLVSNLLSPTPEVNCILDFVLYFCGRLCCWSQFVSSLCLHVFYVTLQSSPFVDEAHFLIALGLGTWLSLPNKEAEMWFQFWAGTWSSSNVSTCFLDFFITIKKNMPWLGIMVEEYERQVGETKIPHQAQRRSPNHSQAPVLWEKVVLTLRFRWFLRWLLTYTLSS